jgi:membrane protein implicated in regulation of membrane protease activity
MLWLTWFWVIWLVGGLALLGLELHSQAFFAFFLAVGAFGAALVAALVNEQWWPSVAVFAGLSGAGLALVRPVFVRITERRQGPPLVLPGPAGVGALVGQRALTLDAVGDEHHPGHAQLAGERWLAVTNAPGGLQPDTAVKVIAVRGTTLVVTPFSGV